MAADASAPPPRRWGTAHRTRALPVRVLPVRVPCRRVRSPRGRAAESGDRCRRRGRAVMAAGARAGAYDVGVAGRATAGAGRESAVAGICGQAGARGCGKAWWKPSNVSPSRGCRPYASGGCGKAPAPRGGGARSGLAGMRADVPWTGVGGYLMCVCALGERRRGGARDIGAACVGRLLPLVGPLSQRASRSLSV